MNRIVIGLLVAATAGVATWWASRRSARPRTIVLAGAEPEPSASSTDKSVITPKGNIDPGMVRIRPDVDPKMVVTPPWPPRPPQQPTGPSEQ